MSLVAGVVAWLLALAAPRPLRRVFARLHRDERGGLPKPPNPFDPDTWKGLFSRVGGGVELIGDVLNVVLDIIPTFVGTIATMAETIGTLTANAGSTVFDAIAGSVSLLWSVIANFAAGLFQRVEAAASLIWGVVANLASGLFERLENVGSLIWGVIANLASGLFDRIENVGSLIWGVIANFASGIFERVEGLASTVFSVIAVVGGGIADRLLDVATTIRDAITFVGSLYVDWLRFLVDAVVGLGQKVENIGETIASKGIEEAGQHKKELIEILLGLGIPGGLALALVDTILLNQQGFDALTWGGKKAAEAGRDAATQALDMLAGGGQITPESAPFRALELLAVQSTIGEALAGLAVAKEFIPTLDNSATAYLMAFLGHFSGWEPSIEAIYHPIVHAGVGRPMEQLVNANTVTNIPGEGVLSELLGRRDIDGSVYDGNLAYHGFRPFWKTVFEPSSYRPARIFELARIMQFTDISDDALQELLQSASYPDHTIEALTPVLKAVALSRANNKLLTEANEAFQKGFLDEGTYLGYLTDAGVKPTEQLQWLKASRLNYVNQIQSDLLSVWRSAAARGAMTAEEHAASLSAIGVTGEKIRVEQLRAEAAQLRKPVEDEPANTKAAVNKARAALSTAYQLQYAKGLIDEGGLHDRLTFVGFPENVASAIVELARTKKLPDGDAVATDTPEAVSRRIRTTLQQAYIVQFQHELIDAGQLRTSLLQIGVNDFEAAAIVAREQAKATPKPKDIEDRTAERVAADVQSSLKRAYARQFQDGLISVGDLESQLVAIGMDPAAAHAFAVLQQAISYHPDEAGDSAEDKLHARQVQSARRAAAIERFRVGVIDLGDMRDELLAAGLFADVVDAIAAEEEARAVGQQRMADETIEQFNARELRSALKASAVQQYRAQLIDEEGLVGLLIEAGLAEDVAIAIATAELARTLKPTKSQPAAETPA